MPLIKNITAISYSSQDPKHPLSALLKGTGAWLCSPDDRSGRLSADLQLDRAISISYIDVGNHNSMTLSVEVSRSCSSSGTTCALLPTVALMTPQEFRAQHAKCKAVRMFRADDLDKRALKEQWDRVRITCTQPFKRGVQFGLSFFKLYTSEVLPPPTVHPSLPSAVGPLFPLPPNAADGPADVAGAVSHGQAGSDPCLQSKLDCKKKTPAGKSLLSDENILQRLQSVSPSHASFKKNHSLISPGFNQSKNTSKSPQSFANNLKDLQHKTTSQQSPMHAVQAKENHGRGASKTHKNASASPQSAAQRFRSALEKLCTNQAGVSPTVVAKQNFMKKFGSSTAEEGSDGRSPGLPICRADTSGVSAGAGAAAASSKAEFEYEALEFLIALDLQRDQILQLKVADVRVQFEAQRGEPLSRPQRLCFKNLALDYCARWLDTLDFESESSAFSGSQKTASTARSSQSGPRGAGSSSASNFRESSAGSGKNISSATAAAASPSGRLPAVSCGDSQSALIGSSLVGGSGRQIGITDTPSATGVKSVRKCRDSSGREVVVANGHFDVPDVCDSARNVARAGSERKFTFKKLEFGSPSSSQSSPVSGSKPPRFNRTASKSPMPFYDDYDSPQAVLVAEKLKRNFTKMSPKAKESTKKRKKEEPKPVADGEWVQSKKVRVHVSSSSPRNAPRKGACDDVVEIVDLDDCDARESIHKTTNNNSPSQDNNGWLKIPRPNRKHENSSREFSGDISKLVNTENIGTTRQARPTPKRRAESDVSFTCSRSSDTDNSDSGSTDTTSQESLAADVSPVDDVSEGKRRGKSPLQSGGVEGFRLGAAPTNKFGLRAQPRLQQEKKKEAGEDESVECPLCSRLFPSLLIEEHAATCGRLHSSRATEARAAGTRDDGAGEECPVCAEQVEEEEYAQHVLNCADRHFEV